MNVIIIINGATGSGKTYAALELADQISKACNTPFETNTNVAFNVVDLILKSELSINKKRGSCLIFEEVGAMGGGASSREWQSKNNKGFFSFLQTDRHRNKVIIMTTPSFAYLEAGARKLCHMQIDMRKIDLTNKLATLKPYLIQINTRKDKLYFKYMRVTYKNEIIRFNEMILPHPRMGLVNEYEKIKVRYTTQLRKQIIANGEALSNGRKIYRKAETKEVEKLMLKGLTNLQMCKILGISENTLLRRKKEIRSNQKLSKTSKNRGTSPVSTPNHVAKPLFNLT